MPSPTGMNVVMQAEVDPDKPITINLKGVKAAEALETILSSVNYFFTLKGNIIIIRAFDTMIFEMGRPSVIQQYSVNVGGDILGATKTSGSGVTGDVAQRYLPITLPSSSGTQWKNPLKAYSVQAPGPRVQKRQTQRLPSTG